MQASKQIHMLHFSLPCPYLGKVHLFLDVEKEVVLRGCRLKVGVE